MTLAQELADAMTLGAALLTLRERFGEYELIEHWKQGEFHHDLLVRVGSTDAPYVVIATNCNGGIKEVLRFSAHPDRWALWHHRCPENPAFTGELGPVKDRARTQHWFNPCELLDEAARSELRPEFRKKQRGGGWEPNY